MVSCAVGMTCFQLGPSLIWFREIQWIRERVSCERKRDLFQLLSPVCPRLPSRTYRYLSMCVYACSETYNVCFLMCLWIYHFVIISWCVLSVLKCGGCKHSILKILSLYHAIDKCLSFFIFLFSLFVLSRLHSPFPRFPFCYSAQWREHAVWNTLTHNCIS